MHDAHIAREDLSAYIDGEAAQADRIARHLQHCDACARQHLAMLKVSAHVRALPAPHFSGDLLARVMGEIAGIRDARAAAPPRVVRRAAMRRFAAPLAAAAMVAVGAALTLTAWRHAPDAPAPAQTGAALEAGPDYFEDVALVDAMDDGMDEDDAWPLDGLLDTLADGAAEAPEDDVFDAGGDVFAAIDTLEPGEAAAFGELLAAYASEG